jgi:hypothetical protein
MTGKRRNLGIPLLFLSWPPVSRGPTASNFRADLALLIWFGECSVDNALTEIRRFRLPTFLRRIED